MSRDTECFYSWTACDGRGRGACGVTGDRDQATALMNGALDGLAAEATGSVQVVRLDRYARDPSYIYGSVVVRARRIPAVGASEGSS